MSVNTVTVSKKAWNLFIGAVVLIGAGWIYLTRIPSNGTTGGSPPPSPMEGFSAPGFTLDLLGSDSSNEKASLSDYRGQVVMINFWATWCPPCREEMPVFSKLQEEFAQHDVHFIGIAIDDLEAVQEFIDSYAIDFTILLGDTQAIALSERLGNRFSALPFTVIVDKRGKVKLRHAGGIKEEQLRPVLAGLIK